MLLGGGKSGTWFFVTKCKSSLPTLSQQCCGEDDEISPTTSGTRDTNIPGCVGGSLHQIQRDLGLHVRSV